MGSVTEENGLGEAEQTSHAPKIEISILPLGS